MGPSIFQSKSTRSLDPTSTNPPIPRGTPKSSSLTPPSMVHRLHEILCLRHSDTSIPEQISTLSSSLRKRPQGLHLKRLSTAVQGIIPEQKFCATCSIHEQLAAAPLNHLTALIGFELHTHTQALHALHPATRTEVTNVLLQKLHSWYSSRLFLPGNVINGCLACALTCFFNDEEAVRALAIVARSGHKKGREQVQIIREGWLGLKSRGTRREAHEVTKDRNLGQRRGFSNGGAEPEGLGTIKSEAQLIAAIDRKIQEKALEEIIRQRRREDAGKLGANAPQDEIADRRYRAAYKKLNTKSPMDRVAYGKEALHLRQPVIFNAGLPPTPASSKEVPPGSIEKPKLNLKIPDTAVTNNFGPVKKLAPNNRRMSIPSLISDQTTLNSFPSSKSSSFRPETNATSVRTSGDMVPGLDLQSQTKADDERREEDDWWDVYGSDDENVILPEVKDLIEYSPSVYSDNGTDNTERHIMEHEALLGSARVGNCKMPSTRDYEEAVEVWGQARVR